MNLSYVVIANVLSLSVQGVDFKRQNLTSKDVRFWRVMSNPSLKDKRFIKAEDPEHMYSNEVERAK